MSNEADFLRATVAVFLTAKVITQLWLEWLNQNASRKHATALPEAYRDVMNEETFAQSVRYTLAKSKLHQLEVFLDALLLAVVLFSGMLPWAYQTFAARFGVSTPALAAFIFVIGLALALFDLPLSWYAQFRLEHRFGFNTTTQPTWWSDRAKGLLLAAILGYPLLCLILKLADWMGILWWLWAWAAMIGFQLLIAVLAPVLIMPWFNKFAPLPEGSLRERLLELARRTHFRAASIQVMDGSKRSRHSNAFFTGFGRFRKIVLFDTLINQLSEAELEAVLAHEIGHYKKKHLLKMLVFSAAASLGGLYCLSVLARQSWFFEAFHFPSGNIAIALLLFGLLSGVFTFWFSPLGHWWSRRYEYQADGYAKEVMKGGESLIGALRKLNEKNLSNLSPHPLYSGFYYSHPTLLERERVLKVQADQGQTT